MVDAKKIGVAGAAIVLVTLVAVFATSYMSDFETARTPNAEDETKSIQLKGAPYLGSKTATSVTSTIAAPATPIFFASTINF